MRFRANIEHPGSREIQKRCIIKFSGNEMHIICNTEAGEGGVQVWSQIKVTSLFTDYRIQSNANNEIYLSLSTEAMTAALRSAAAPSGQQAALAADAEVVMKCACEEDEVAVLTFEIATTTRMGRYVRIAHDEPMCPEPELRAVVERNRYPANLSGCLQLCAQTDSSRVDVSWNGLSNPEWHTGSGQLGRARPTTLYGVLVSLRSLRTPPLLTHHVSVGICQNHCIILYVYIGEMAEAGGILTFYIPAIIE
ncbi:Hus1-like protein-domain-containing protein [Fomitopsis serialis]|uniref:Hus1-like protein-domain-containing protein n=1 Tax=Fomitopsis serialis TaxID=139415 RepID=UPI00200825CF|nr:Hus1-like protein-domain-containing protein [Neoantrodia serialis]KAH9917269.1 Hus1-like protein-domain-containing protein [Neoantrodia serialis]